MIGKYHPHGDQSVYDAMVRLAQDFALRYPLVDGQGNFGNIDGDNAAAYRYTEARLTAVAQQLMAGLDEGTVDFRPTYNGEEEEPEVFPGLFPNLLANGASGIAVGMATSIPPHNVGELIERRDPPDRQSARRGPALMDFVVGPGLPDRRRAGRRIARRSPAPMRPGAAASGCGRRSRWSARRAGAGTCWSTKIPYGVQKGKLIEQIAELIADKKLPILADVRDESDEQVRIVLEPRSADGRSRAAAGEPLPADRAGGALPAQPQRARQDADAGRDEPQAGAARLARVPDRGAGQPLAHRIGKIDDRLELLDGFLIAFLNLDRVIEIIRTEDEPKPVMIAEFALTDRQAEAILNMRLRSLRKLEEMEIGKERDALAKEREELAQAGREPGAAAHAAEEGPRRAEGEVRRRAADADRGAAPAREIDWRR